MDVIMTEPTCRRHGNGEEACGYEWDRMRSGNGTENTGGPEPQLRVFVYHVPLPITFGFQLFPKLSEGELSGRVRFRRRFELLNRSFLGLGQSLVHVPPLLRVEAVHHFRGIPAVVPVDPVSTGRMRLPPAAQIVPSAMQTDVQRCATDLVVAGWDGHTVGVFVALPGRCRVG